MDNFNPYYNDCFFSTEGGLEESLWVFVEGNRIDRFSPTDDIYAGETGFGTGLNFLALCDYIGRTIRGYSGILDYFSCEKYPLTPEQVEKLLDPLFCEKKAILSEYMDVYKDVYGSVSPGLNSFEFELFSIKIRLTYYYGDASSGLPSIREKRDVWFLDGHDPEKNPDMWSSDIFSLVGNKSHKGTTLATYTSKGDVKKGLREAGFFIKRKKGYGKKRHMIQGEYTGS